MEKENPKIENLITESDLCELLGCSKNELSRLRQQEGLPYLRVNRKRRLYLESDIMEWLISRRVPRSS